MLEEGVEVEDKAIRYVAKVADGSMRDGLSLLDQCIAFYYGKKLTYDNVLEVLGAVDIEVFGRMLKNILADNIVGCIELLEEMMINGREIGQFVIDFTWYLRNLLLVKTTDQALDIVDVSSDNIEVIRQEATLLDADTLMRYIRILSELSNQVKYASNKRVLVEIGLIKLCRPAMEKNYDSVLNRLSVIEAKLENGIQVNTTQHRLEETLKEEKEVVPVVLPKAVPEDLKAIAENWKSIMMKVSPPIRALLQHAVPSIGGDSTLLLVFNEAVDKAFIDGESHMQEIKDTIQNITKKEIQIQTKLVNQGKESMNNFPDLTKIINMNINYS